MTSPAVFVPRDLPRTITILVTVSVVVNVILAIAFVGIALYGVHLGDVNAKLGRQIHDSQVVSCRYSNTTRVQDIAIWNRLLTLTPAQKASETAAAKAEVADLERLVRAKDTPVNCTALYATHT